jgi:hypothetical protein
VTTSIFLAKLIGPFFLLVGLSLLVNQAQFGIIANEFLQSPALVFLTGLIILPAGLAVVLTHNVWAADWRVLITLLGWLSLISGIIRLLVPKRALDVGRRLYARPNVLHVSAAIWLVVGAVLSFYGYLG